MGVRAIAALIFRGGVIRAAISIFGLAGSMDDERLPEMIRQMMNTAHLISSELTLMTKGVNEPEGATPAWRSAGVRGNGFPIGARKLVAAIDNKVIAVSNFLPFERR